MTDETIERRAMTWLASRDTGTSSKTICRHMLGLPQDMTMEPGDPSDLGRCLRLLALIPEWAPRIGEMAVYGRYWAALVARWDELAALMADEVGIGWAKGRSAPKTFALMRSIVDPVMQADATRVRFGNVTISTGA